MHKELFVPGTVSLMAVGMNNTRAQVFKHWVTESTAKKFTTPSKLSRQRPSRRIAVVHYSYPYATSALLPPVILRELVVPEAPEVLLAARLVDLTELLATSIFLQSTQVYALPS